MIDKIITKGSVGTVIINGVTYKAYKKTFTNEWYIVEGDTCFGPRVASGIKAKSAKSALQQWINSKNT